MTTRPHFTGALVLRSQGEDRPRVVVGEFGFYSALLGRTVTVPDGFETDLASVPRLPLVYLVMADHGDEAAVIHDYLYSTRAESRKTCDAVFREACGAMGLSGWRSWAMWLGVRVGGGRHY